MFRLSENDRIHDGMAGNLGGQKCSSSWKVFVGEFHEPIAGNHARPFIFHDHAFLARRTCRRSPNSQPRTSQRRQTKTPTSARLPAIERTHRRSKRDRQRQPPSFCPISLDTRGISSACQAYRRSNARRYSRSERPMWWRIVSTGIAPCWNRRFGCAVMSSPVTALTPRRTISPFSEYSVGTS